jgi:hypothetical protein
VDTGVPTQRTPAPVYPVKSTPSGRRLVIEAPDLGKDNDVQLLLLENRTGRLVAHLAAQHEAASFVTFEDDNHLVFPDYDGPPNPLLDPNDLFATAEEVDWPNLLVLARGSQQSSHQLARYALICTNTSSRTLDSCSVLISTVGL